MLQGLAVLLLFQFAGELVARLGGLPIPGPVIGMVLLLVGLELGLPRTEGLETASSGILAHLSLLFVPAGVGILQHLPRLRAEWPALAASLLVSTLATVAVTGWLAQRLTAWQSGRRGEA